MQFGLTNAPTVFQDLVKYVLWDMLLPAHTACPDLEPAWHSVPPGLLFMTFCLSTTILLPAPWILINIRNLPPVSASGSHPVPL
jgi:hypothetical protein